MPKSRRAIVLDGSEGEGGGQIGWALSTVVVSLFGSVAAVVFYAVIFVLSVLVNRVTFRETVEY